MSHGYTWFSSEGHGFRRFVTVCAAWLLTLSFSGCGDVSPEQAAALAAQGYYRHLVAGEYEEFLEGKAGSDSLPELYREQLLTAYRQFHAQQQAHRGIREVSISNARRDTLTHYVSVFLLLNYGDSTREEIVVPMVDYDGRWRMK